MRFIRNYSRHTKDFIDGSVCETFEQIENRKLERCKHDMNMEFQKKCDCRWCRNEKLD